MHTALTEFPHERTEFSDANYAAIGRALAFATSFEAVCRSLSSLHRVRQRIQEILPSVSDSDSAFASAVSEVWEHRLKQHVKRILEYHEFSSGITETVKRAISARNVIAHEIALGVAHTIETQNGRSDLLSRLSVLVRSIADGLIIVEFASLVETGEPLPSFQFLTSYTTRIADWVSQPLIQ